MNNSLYKDLYAKYKVLSYEEKKEKLNNILDKLWKNFAAYDEAKELLSYETTSEQYLDELYEAIMVPFCETYENNKNTINTETSKRISDLKERMAEEQKKSAEEAESLLEQINVF